MNITSKMESEQNDKTEKKYHDCEEEKCGENTTSPALVCYACGKISYARCVGDREEIFEFLKAIKVVKYDDKDKRYKLYMDDENKRKLEQIISTDTMIRFVCEKCALNGSEKEKIEKIERDLIRVKNVNNDLQAKLDEESRRVEELEKKNRELEEMAASNRKVIEELTEAAENPNEMVESEAEEEDENDTSEMKQMKKMIKNTIEKKMRSEMNKMSRILSERIEQMSEKNRAQNDEKQEGKEKKKESEENPFKKGRTVSFNGNERRKGEKERERAEDERNDDDTKNEVRFSENLKPAKQTPRRENRIYSIYVAKFDFGTSLEMIEQHIMSNIEGVDKNTFIVEEIKSNSERRPDYIAFKITTLKYEIYSKMKQIWAPNFTARDFKPTTNERTPVKNGQNNYREYEGRRNEYEYQTPRKQQYTQMNGTRYGNRRDNFEYGRGKGAANERNEKHTAWERKPKVGKMFTPENQNYERKNGERGQQHTQQRGQKTDFFGNNSQGQGMRHRATNQNQQKRYG